MRLPTPVLWRIAGTGAAAIMLMATAQSGLPARVLAGAVSSTAASTTAVPTASAPPPTATVAPAPTATPVPREEWRQVAYTDGLGLVLRPEPAAATRVRNLPEGTRLRITGSAVSQAGHAWLPVQTLSDQAGWVAAEYLVAAQ